MALLLKPLRCPHCQAFMDQALLKKHKQLRSVERGQSFPCPHCEKRVRLPKGCHQLTLAGLYFLIILSPLFLLWPQDWISPLQTASIGLALTIAGLCLQILKKA